MRRSFNLIAGLCCCTLTLGCSPEVLNAILANTAKAQGQAVVGGYTTQPVESQLIQDAATQAITQSDRPLAKKTVKPPDWLGFSLISIGAVLILHSWGMKKPGG